MTDKEFLQNILDNREKFWKERYPKMSLEEKKKYWLASTHKGMRTQGEAFADPYSEFSKGWYDFAKEHEPQFDEIFDYVTKNLGFEFDWKEFTNVLRNNYYQFSEVFRFGVFIVVKNNRINWIYIIRLMKKRINREFMGFYSI